MLYNYLFIYRGNAAYIPVIVTLAIIVVALCSFILINTLKRKFVWPSTCTYILLAADLFGFSHEILRLLFECIGNFVLYL